MSQQLPNQPPQAQWQGQPPPQAQWQQGQGQPPPQAQWQQGQPPPQQQPGQMMFMANPGAVGYYPQAQPGMPQVVMGAQMVQYQPPKYEYIPQDFRTLTILTIFFCGLFSPFSLVFSIPALLFANKSRASARNGATKVARSQGMMAAYLNIAAIIFALVLGLFLTGLVIGLYGKTYAFNQCYERAEEIYGRLQNSNGASGSYRQYYYCGSG